MVWSNMENPILSCNYGSGFFFFSPFLPSRILEFSSFLLLILSILFFKLNTPRNLSLLFLSYSVVIPPLCSAFQLSYCLHIILSPSFCFLSLFCWPVGRSVAGQAKHLELSLLNKESSWFPVLTYFSWYFSCLQIYSHISLSFLF